MIQIHSVKQEWTRNVYTCSIPGNIRRDYSDQQIINMVDAGGDEAQYNCCNNFGGKVEPIPGGLYRVTVSID